MVTAGSTHALPPARSHLIPASLLQFSNEYLRHAISILDGTYDHLLSALADYGWIAPRPDTPLRVHFDALFRSAGRPLPQHPIECNSLLATRAMLLESDRVMLLSAHQTHYERRVGLLVALPHPAGPLECVFDPNPGSLLALTEATNNIFACQHSS